MRTFVRLGLLSILVFAKNNFDQSAKLENNKVLNFIQCYQVNQTNDILTNCKVVHNDNRSIPRERGLLISDLAYTTINLNNGCVSPGRFSVIQ
jgi:hypothetical protein